MRNIEIFIALRYFTGTKRNIFGFLTLIIGVAGISLGVAALIITLAVMDGFHNDIRARILGLNSHIVVTGRDIENAEVINRKIKETENVEETAPFIYGQVILKTRGEISGAILKGIDINKEKKVVPIEKISFRGDWNGLSNKGIVIGNELAKNLSLETGDDVILVSPNEMSFTGMPLISKFSVTGIFKSGMYDYDSGLVYTDVISARRIFSLKGITGFSVRLSDISKTSYTKKLLKETLPHLNVISWEEVNKNLFAALKLEKFVMFILLTLIIVVACFNIISNLLILGVEKARDIGILSALGMSRKSIRRIFLFEGLITGFLGVIAGTIMGIVISLVLGKYQFIKLPPDIYYLDRMPVKINTLDVISVILLTLVVTVISAVYPAIKTSRIDPLEIIRYG